MKNVILMGKGELSVRAAEWFQASSDYNLVAIVPVIPEPTWSVSLSAWGRKNNIPIIDSGHYKDLEGVKEKEWNIDLVFSVFYDRIIKEWFINKCRSILNLHNGPLPKYRGVSPINWALKNEEIIHGVSIHEITPGIDDGPIVSQVLYSIYPEFDEVVDVYNRALEYGWTLFTQTMPILAKIKAAHQDHDKATYFHATQNNLLMERRFFTKKESLPQDISK